MTQTKVLQETEYEYAYESSRPATAHSFLVEPLLSMLPVPTNTQTQKMRVLDLGCGNGSLSHVVAQKGYEVFGIEESAQGVNVARQSFPDCHFLQASIYELPYEELENSFDVVISVEVIEHLFYPKELIRAAKKCLKPNGTLILTTPYHGYWKNLLLSVSNKMDGHFHALWDGGHIKFFSVNTLTNLLETEGYIDIKFKFAGRLPYLWKSMLCSCTFSQP
jgi:2-polyprenyl-3-methyl-5-hydroxy-6-metoxy-1,4-benzoquinol methylase